MDFPPEALEMDGGKSRVSRWLSSLSRDKRDQGNFPRRGLLVEKITLANQEWF